MPSASDLEGNFERAEDDLYDRPLLNIDFSELI